MIFDYDFYTFLIKTAVFAVLAISYGLIRGLAGIPMLCMAVFYGVGAYTTAIFTKHLGISNIILLLPLSGIFSVIASAPLLVAIRRIKGELLALCTFIYGISFPILILSWKRLKGAAGITEIPDRYFFEIVLDHNHKSISLISVYAILLFALLVSFYIHKTIFGQVLNSIRQNEILSSASGYNVFVEKVKIFIIGAFISGMAGCISLTQYNINVVNPNFFSLDISIRVLLMAILGGLGSFFGPVIGAYAIELATFSFSLINRLKVIPPHSTTSISQILFAILLVITVSNKQMRNFSLVQLIQEKLIQKALKRFRNDNSSD